MNPPPLPQNKPGDFTSSSTAPIASPTDPPTRSTFDTVERKNSGMKWIRNSVLAVALLAVVIIGALAATCPDEPQMRNAVYGEMDPTYKQALEWLGAASKIVHGPCLVYRNHLIYSTLDFRKLDGSEVRFASGAANKIKLTPDVKQAKEFLLSIPIVRKWLEKR